MHLKEIIILHAHFLLTFRGLKVNITEGTYMIIPDEREYHFDNK